MIRRRNDRQHKDKKKKKLQWSKTTLHRKLKIEQHLHHNKSGVNLGAPEGIAVPAPLLCLCNNYLKKNNQNDPKTITCLIYRGAYTVSV